MKNNRQLVDIAEARSFIEANWPHDPLLRRIGLNLLDMLPRVEQRWIPVSEKLPELIPCNAGTAYSEAVNVLTSERKVLTAIWDGTDFIADAEFWEAENEEITHWTPVLLPLPELSKEESNGKWKAAN